MVEFEIHLDSIEGNNIQWIINELKTTTNLLVKDQEHMLVLMEELLPFMKQLPTSVHVLAFDSKTS
jgi:hypothetical protein